MFYILHRINTADLLKRVPLECGVEIDLRDNGGRLILTHDAFSDGEEFWDYLSYFRHAFLLVNIKCEGIEEEVLRVLKEKGIDNFFLLDLSFPAMVKLFRKSEKRIAVRVSEYEGIEQALRLKDYARWVWVDCFKDFWLDAAKFNALKAHLKLCLVSPELQGHPLDRIEEFAKKIKGMTFDAICTKRQDIWMQELGAGQRRA